MLGNRLQFQSHIVVLYVQNKLHHMAFVFKDNSTIYSFMKTHEISFIFCDISHQLKVSFYDQGELNFHSL